VNRFSLNNGMQSSQLYVPEEAILIVKVEKSDEGRKESKNHMRIHVDIGLKKLWANKITHYSSS
jgi:hypothetical protein